jgi:hypothetical protein
MESINGLSPTNRQAIRVSQSIAQTIPEADHRQPRGLEHRASDCHPRPQQLQKCHYQSLAESAAHQTRTPSHSKLRRRDGQPYGRTKGVPIKEMVYTNHPGPQPSGQSAKTNGGKVEEGLEGVARSEEPISAISIDQASPEKTWTLSNRTSRLSSSIPAPPPPSMDYPPYVPRLPPDPLHRYKRIWRKLLKTPT